MGQQDVGVNTMRTARSRTSGENLFDLFMAPSSQELEPPQNPGRFSPAACSSDATVECRLTTNNSCERPPGPCAFERAACQAADCRGSLPSQESSSDASPLVPEVLSPAGGAAINPNTSVEAPYFAKSVHLPSLHGRTARLGQPHQPGRHSYGGHRKAETEC